MNAFTREQRKCNWTEMLNRTAKETLRGNKRAPSTCQANEDKKMFHYRFRDNSVVFH